MLYFTGAEAPIREVMLSKGDANGQGGYSQGPTLRRREAVFYPEPVDRREVPVIRVIEVYVNRKFFGKEIRT